MLKAPVIILREGADASQGVPQLVHNINACSNIVDMVKTTLGPRGMDKLIVSQSDGPLITNDGATILKHLDIVHPAARSLVDVARAQDAEVGDGTTSVVVVAGEILKSMKGFVEDGLAPQVIIRAIRQGEVVAVQRVKDIAVAIANSQESLVKCAETAMNSKLIHHQREFFARMVVQAITTLDQSTLNPKLIGVKRVVGGALEDSFLVDGVAFEKTFSYAGFEQQPKTFADPRICCLNVELELKAERDNAEVRIDKVSDYQAIVDAEWSILYDKLEQVSASGAKVVFSRLPIGDVATQFFADRDIFCAGRVSADDMDRVVCSTGASLQTAIDKQTLVAALGSCAVFEERQIGGKRFNILQGCPGSKSCTIIIRGGSDQFLAEVDRSLNDALMIVRRAVKSSLLIAGGGAVEMQVSKTVREAAMAIPGTAQAVMSAYAQAFEVIPRQLCENAGMDGTSVLAKLRKAHFSNTWAGVNIGNDQGDEVADMWEKGVWEPALVKLNMISAATEAAIAILSIDLTVKAAPPPGEADNLGKMAARAGLQ